MTNYEVDVSYLDKYFDTVPIEGAEDKDQAEYDALNLIRDQNPDATHVEVMEIREIG
jgi:hypothetical protein